MNTDGYLHHRYKTDIYALSVSSGNYVLNTLFDNGKTMGVTSAIESITKKINDDMKLPEEM